VQAKKASIESTLLTPPPTLTTMSLKTERTRRTRTRTRTSGRRRRRERGKGRRKRCRIIEEKFFLKTCPEETGGGLEKKRVELVEV
jgi:hypothetical protein